MGGKVKSAGVFASMVLAIGMLAAQPAVAQDKVYKEGSVWSVGLVKVKPGMLDQFTQDLAATRKPILDELQKQGLILSHKMLWGTSNGRDDFNLILLVEHKDWATFDRITAKTDEISKKVYAGEEKRVQLMVKRADMREMLGLKNMQELTFR